MRLLSQSQTHMRAAAVGDDAARPEHAGRVGEAVRSVDARWWRRSAPVLRSTWPKTRDGGLIGQRRVVLEDAMVAGVGDPQAAAAVDVQLLREGQTVGADAAD